MKKLIAIIICVIAVLSFAGCGKNNKNENDPTGNKTENAADNNVADGNNSAQKMQTVLDPSEYILYQNIFYNDQGSEYADKDVTKKGVFTKLTDEYNKVTRYYVWGYNDNTKCCDWQWEFVPNNAESLPAVGSTVTVKGKLVYDEAALDKYWIVNADVTVDNAYQGSDADVDLTTMGGTLERVQIINMQQFNESFEGKKVAVYGRIASPTSVQHPYYDKTFEQEFVSSDPVQAIGTVVIVSGEYKAGVIENASVTVTTDY